MSSLDPFSLSVIAPTRSTPHFILPYDPLISATPCLSSSSSQPPFPRLQGLQVDFSAAGGFWAHDHDHVLGELQVAFDPLASGSTYSTSIRSPEQRYREHTSKLTRRSPVQQSQPHMSPHRFGDNMEKGGKLGDQDAIILDTPVVSPLIGMTKFISPPSTPNPALCTAPTKQGLASSLMMAKAVVNRGVRSARRGNLPFLVVFVSCAIIFFSALAGVGYVPPAEPPATSLRTLQFDGKEEHQAMMENQRKLEVQWAAKRRPSDGAWMNRRRDDKAIRRKPAHVPVPQITVEEPQEAEKVAEQQLVVREEQLQLVVQSDETAVGDNIEVTLEKSGDDSEQVTEATEGRREEGGSGRGD